MMGLDLMPEIPGNSAMVVDGDRDGIEDREPYSSTNGEEFELIRTVE